MSCRKWVGLIGTVFATLLLGLPSMAASAASGNVSNVPKVDLSTPAGIASYLLSKGIDPSTAIWQRGLNNYAGPSCPGVGWTCTSDTSVPVVQIALPAGINEVECEPTFKKCVAVQTQKESGQNVFRCYEKASGSPAVTQDCDIAQMGTSPGGNSAFIEQYIDQNSGSTQTGTQTASVLQMNDVSRNFSHVLQRVSQSTSEGTTQGQEIHQSAIVTQTNESGDNASELTQSQDQKATASATGAIIQDQNAVQGTNSCGMVGQTPNMCADVTQTAITGRNTSHLGQSIDQNATAKSPAGNITQTQGSSAGGLEGLIIQNSSGVSTNSDRQDENQTLSATTTGILTQTQFGPVRCCLENGSNPNNSEGIVQVSTQKAGGGANQFNDLTGGCESSGHCSIDEKVVENQGTTTNSCDADGSGCSIFITCFEGECFTEGG
jgi:hypothetical protein